MSIFCFLQNLDQSASASNDYLTHQNLKFLFYHFNNYFNRQRVKLLKVRHTTVIKNKIAIKMDGKK